MNIELTIDESANSAYIRLLSSPVKISKTINDDVIIDLNEMDVVVGIEILDLEAEIPFTELITEFHVHSQTVELLRRLRPSISGFMSGFSNDGTQTSGARVGAGTRQ
jgi:uncharacterized protein YuzE